MSGAWAIRYVTDPPAVGVTGIDAETEDEAFSTARAHAARIRGDVEVLRTWEGQGWVPYAVAHPGGRVE